MLAFVLNELDMADREAAERGEKLELGSYLKSKERDLYSLVDLVSKKLKKEVLDQSNGLLVILTLLLLILTLTLTLSARPIQRTKC